MIMRSEYMERIDAQHTNKSDDHTVPEQDLTSRFILDLQAFRSYRQLTPIKDTVRNIDDVSL